MRGTAHHVLVNRQRQPDLAARPSTSFTFSVTFRDNCDRAPNNIAVIVDGTQHALVGPGSGFSAGVTFATTMTLPAGSHPYSFTATHRRSSGRRRLHGEPAGRHRDRDRAVADPDAAAIADPDAAAIADPDADAIADPDADAQADAHSDPHPQGHAEGDTESHAEGHAEGDRGTPFDRHAAPESGPGRAESVAGTGALAVAVAGRGQPVPVPVALAQADADTGDGGGSRHRRFRRQRSGWDTTDRLVGSARGRWPTDPADARAHVDDARRSRPALLHVRVRPTPARRGG